MAPTQKIYTALGLMSGTSLDGIDVAWLQTDGHHRVITGPAETFAYAPGFINTLRKTLGQKNPHTPAMKKIERQMTWLHAKAVKKFCLKNNILLQNIDVIGFHGQTIFHAPQHFITLQIGDGALLARETQCRVVNQFRGDDVKAGGHGAPLVPVFHAALAHPLPKPLAVVNVGGVSNITWLAHENTLAACDCGPGNALINDWLHSHNAGAFDDKGTFAARGSIDWAHVHRFLADDFFARPAPKSLDRDHFKTYMPHHLDLADGAATLTAMTAAAIARTLQHFGRKPQKLLVSGGGRHNTTLMRWLASLLHMPVMSVDHVGWNGDALEAQAFAYLAVRRLLNLPISFPSTTGVQKPMCGGLVHTFNL